jgi:hypothetical protein
LSLVCAFGFSDERGELLPESARREVAGRPEIQMLHLENARKGFFEPAQQRAVKPPAGQI